MKLTKNVIAFQNGFIINSGNKSEDNKVLAMNVQAELMQFGYILSEDALDSLSSSFKEVIISFQNEVISYLKYITGGEDTYRPIYSGFPQQVMEMSEWELWINQLIGYWCGGSFIADEWTKTKGTAFEYVNYKSIQLKSESAFNDIFTNLLAANTSLTPVDSEIVKWFINNHSDLKFPEIIPFKETLCLVIIEMIKVKRIFSNLPKLTATDVLRIAVGMSGGNISLGGELSKFKKFARFERKRLLHLLELSSLDVREMKLKVQRWIRLGEILHPGEYQKSYPKSFTAFQKLRNEKVVSWYGEVNLAFQQSFTKGIEKLVERPGEFIRRLDYLIRMSNGQYNYFLLLTLQNTSRKVSNKVLFETYTHFESRRNPTTNRSIMIKGSRKRTQLEDLPALETDLINQIQNIIIIALQNKFASLPRLGKCWIDEELKNIPIPTNLRSLSESSKVVIRGQRFPIDASKKVLRAYVHWYDNTGDLDIDLHGYLCFETKSMSFGFNGEKNNPLGCFSGDVRHRQGRCAEYVDINIEQSLKAGYKYFVIVAHNFNDDSFENIPECTAGSMTREHAEANDTWLPKTIETSIKLQSNNRFCLVGVYDLAKKEYIHLDVDFGNYYTYYHSNTQSKLFEYIKEYISPIKFSLYDLLALHVASRGQLVSKESAETLFETENFLTSYTEMFKYMGI